MVAQKRFREITWGTEQTKYLSHRMALRVAYQFKIRPKVYLIKELTEIGLCMAQSGRPTWMPKDVELKTYDNSWDDWTHAEIEALVDRIGAGKPVELIKGIFNVPDEVMQQALEMAGKAIDETGATIVYHPQLDPDEEPAYFDQFDFPNRTDRDFCNSRWKKYSERIDSTQPQNETTVRAMIFCEAQMRQCEKDMNAKELRTRKAAVEMYSKLKADFSKGAADLALLERQYDIAPEEESFDAIIRRTHQIRPNWRDKDLEIRMGEYNLIQKIADFHRVKLEGGVEDPVRERAAGRLRQPPEEDEEPVSKFSRSVLAVAQSEKEAARDIIVDSTSGNQ